MFLESYTEQKELVTVVAKDNNRLAHRIYDKYGLSVDATDIHQGDIPQIKYTEVASVWDLHNTMEILINELEKYPTSYVRRLGIQAFRIFGEIYIPDPKKVRSVWPNKLRKTHGLASTDPRILYLAVAGADYDQIADTLHHELFHISDYAFSPKRKKRIRKSLKKYSNPSWVKLNPSGQNSYVEGISSRLLDNDMDIVQNGFLSPFCMENDVEDRAYLAEILMSGSYFVEEIIEETKDEILERKFRLLQNIYRGRTNGVMNYDWFHNLF